MKSPTLRKSVLALLFAASFPALAANYYVVTPVPGKKVMNDAISVSLSAASAPAGQVGIAYSGFDLRSALAVTGDPDYTGYGVKWQILEGALPAGLVLNSNGTIAGTPSEAGTAKFTVRAAYKTKSGDQQYQIVTYRIDVALAAGTPPQALVGQAYAYNLNDLLSVRGDPAFNSASVAWSVVSSSLPAGLYLTADGRIGGTPTAGGTGTLTARATYKGMRGEQTYQVVSLDISVALAAATPPEALVGQPYAYNLGALLSVKGDSGFASADVAWSVVSSTLPAGLYLAADGYLRGTPTAGGTGSVTARASYKNAKGEQTYQVVSLNIAVTLAAGTPPEARVGQAYTYNLGALLTVKGDPGFNGSGVSWNVVSSSLPAGLYLTADGFISGTPSAGGSGTVTARATYKNAKGEQTYQVVSLNITVSLAAATLPVGVTGDGYAGYNFNGALTVTGDPAYTSGAATWSLVDGSLPAGLTLSGDGKVAGTPTTAATANFTLKAVYKNKSDQHAYALQVDAAQLTGTLTAQTDANYGNVTVGSSASRTFSFQTTGNTGATGVYASVVGAGTSLAANTCGTQASPVSLAKGGSCQVTVSYAPTAAGTMSGSVAVTWAGPSASSKSLAITGTSTVDYSSLMSGYTSDVVAIGTNAAWQKDVPWYWLSASAEVSAATGTFEFRRAVTVPGTAPVDVYLYGGVDDVFAVLAVNGVTKAANLGLGFSASASTPTFTLQPGVNVISVKVTNGGSAANPAGLALQLRNTDGSVRGSESGWKFKP